MLAFPDIPGQDDTSTLAESAVRGAAKNAVLNDGWAANREISFHFWLRPNVSDRDW